MTLVQRVKNLPTSPGVYQYFDTTGRLLYVGKAKNLKARVSSYFQKNASHTGRIRRMVSEIDRLETIVTDTEIEALILEANLIKTKHPKYNILLRDDKRYPWLAISDEAFPRLYVTRKPNPKSKTKYFGPYTDANALYQTLKVLRVHFPMRQRRIPLFKDRPCMNYDIGACPGPCQQLVTQADYQATVRQLTQLLKGHTRDLEATLSRDMAAASAQLNFEYAAKLRDRLAAVQTFTASQKVMSTDPLDSQDVIAVGRLDQQLGVALLQIREGKLIAKRSQHMVADADLTDAEVLQAFMEQYYLDCDPDEIPAQVTLACEVADSAVLSDWLTQRRAVVAGKAPKKVGLVVPQKGLKRQIVELAQTNAIEALRQSQLSTLSDIARDPTRTLHELQQVLGLPRLPVRMECYDISHVQGFQTVASMVVFTDGKADKAQYRKFKIHSAEGAPDDFASMREVMTRRFKSREADDAWPAPDLVIIDGGKGQLSAAVAAIDDLGLPRPPIISLAKRFEEVFLPGQSRPVLLPKNASALYLLQQIRDEAHRFAITYHRQRRSNVEHTSLLDTIAGLGPARKAKLIAHFQSVSAIQAASPQQLAQALGVADPSRSTIQQLWQALHPIRM
jgi:excinuclease ABC subunit C